MWFLGGFVLGAFAYHKFIVWVVDNGWGSLESQHPNKPYEDHDRFI